jgi:antitoxin component YwqK of YwqJK toxin-antitoxin module
MSLKRIFYWLSILVVAGQAAQCGGKDTVKSDSGLLITERYCYDNGTTRMILPYRNGELDGKEENWHLNGVKAGVASYKNGKNEGLCLTWDSTGFQTFIGHYRLGKPIGLHQGWYGSNRPEKIENYNSSGQKHGLCESWREDGTRKDSMVYENGTIVEERQYFLYGAIRAHAVYKNKLMVSAESYAPDGKLMGKIEKGAGYIIMFSEDSNRRYKVEYKDGKEIGNRLLKNGE